jgi:hypothetical protein
VTAPVIRATGSRVIVALLDHEEQTETITDVFGIERTIGYVEDPATGLAMASDELHQHAGLVLSVGPDATGVEPGDRVVITRHLGEQWEWGGRKHQSVITTGTCECGRRKQTGAILARIVGTGEGRVYEAVGSRILVEPIAEEHDGALVVKAGKPQSGVVLSGEGMRAGDVVHWAGDVGARWEDNGTWWSLMPEQRCKCGRVSGDDVWGVG